MRIYCFICMVKEIVKFIPNLFTLGNLFCGLVGVFLAFNNGMHWAGVLIFIAAVFDFADGFVARLLNAQSELGKQLDSLADMVTFGVLPGVIMFNLILAAQGAYFTAYPELEGTKVGIACIGFLITLLSALRLAQFNIDDRQTENFIGLPTPAVAIFVAGLPIVMEWQYQINMYVPHSLNEFVQLAHLYYWDNFDIGVLLFITDIKFYIISSVILSALLVLPLPVISLKIKGLSWKLNKWRYLFVTLVLVSVFIAFIHEVIYIESLPYLQWLIIPLVIIELVIVSCLRVIFENK